MVTAISHECLNVLLIEDNPGDAHLVMDMLALSKSSAFKVTHVGVARKAIQCLKESEFHAVLLDLSLPDTYGIETIISILEAAPSVSIVVLSGLTNEKMAIQALQHGVQDYLIKGQVDGAQLERALLCAIERNRSTGKMRKQIRELESVIGKLGELDRLKNEFISLVSHELRTPLTIAQLGLNRLAKERTGPLNLDQKKQVNAIRRKIGQLNLFLNDVLNLTSIQSGHVKINTVDVPLGLIVEEAISFLAPLALERRCVIETSPNISAIRVQCDPDKIESILINIIGNAISHNEGVIAVKVGASCINGSVRIWVRDNGKGISAENKARLFLPALGVDEFGKSRVKGLGLAISKALVEAHGGSLVIEDAVPKEERCSSCGFAFDLPEAKCTEKKIAASGSGAA